MLGRALGVALLLAAASAFIPAPIAPRHDLRGVAAPVAARRHLLAPALRMQADEARYREAQALRDRQLQAEEARHSEPRPGRRRSTLDAGALGRALV